MLYEKNISFSQRAMEKAIKMEKIRIAQQAIMGGASTVFIKKITGLSKKEIDEISREMLPLGINPMLI